MTATTPTSRPAAAPALELSAAGIRMAGRQILSDVSVTVAPGEFVGVLGPNGAGKSTLMRAVLGLHPLASGSVTVLGRTPRRARADIGYLPQRQSFDRSTRVRGVDLVQLGLDGTRWGVPLALTPRARRRRATERRQVQEVIALTGASEYAERPIGELSGGEQQRVLIAAALVRRPQLLILDEPLDSLDLPNQAAVAGLLSSIAGEQGVAVLLVAHDVNPLLSYLDRVVYLAGGRALCGSVSEVITTDRLSALYERADRGPADDGRAAGRRRPARGAPPSRAPARMSFSADPLDDLRQLTAYPFMVNALEAGAIVAVLAAIVGWYVVLRRQTFASHTLSVMAFPGATGRRPGRPADGARLLPGLWRGGAGHRRRRTRRALAPERVGGHRHRADGRSGRRLSLPVAQLGDPRRPRDAAVRDLPGDHATARSSCSPAVAVASLGALAVLARPLLFASIDRDVASASGVPVRLVDARLPADPRVSPSPPSAS